MDRGQSLIIPHLFNDTNYAYWKVRMRVFLQSLDEKVWQVVEIGQTKPKKAPVDWDDVKIKAENFNSRALNALFSAVTNEELKKISSTETTKKAQTILQTTHKGTKAIKDSKLQKLTTSFEEIKMEEDELFNEFYAKLKNIVNFAFNIGKTIPEPRKQSSLSQFKNQDRGKKDAKEGSQYTVPSGPKCFRCQGFGHMKQECA